MSKFPNLHSYNSTKCWNATTGSNAKCCFYLFIFGQISYLVWSAELKQRAIAGQKEEMGMSIQGWGERLVLLWTHSFQLCLLCCSLNPWVNPGLIPARYEAPFGSRVITSIYFFFFCNLAFWQTSNLCDIFHRRYHSCLPAVYFNNWVLFIQWHAPMPCLISQSENQSWLPKLHGPYPTRERNNFTYASRSIKFQGQSVCDITCQNATSKCILSSSSCM